MKENKTNGLELEWTDTNSVLQCCLSNIIKYAEPLYFSHNLFIF